MNFIRSGNVSRLHFANNMKISPYGDIAKKKKKYHLIDPSPMKNSSSSDCRIANSAHNFTSQTFLVNPNS